MREGVAIVRYDGDSLALLKDCRVAGQYGFIGTTRKEQMIRLEDADEIRVNMPLSGLALVANLQGELARGSVLDVALVWIGQLRTTFSQVELAQLEGSCQGATHFIRGAMVGAFGMRTSRRAEAQSVAKLFSVGVDAGSRSKSDIQVVEGDLTDCGRATPDSDRAPPQCGVPIRLELNAIAAKAEFPKQAIAQSAALPNPCAQNWVVRDGKCSRAKRALAHQCRLEDVADCETQCALGNAASCLNHGYALERGEATKRDESRAAGQYKKACDAGLGLGCHNLGYLYSNGLGVAVDHVTAAKHYRDACDAAEPRGCNSLGAMYFMGRGVPADLSKAGALMKSACNGGLGEACANVGSLLLTDGLRRAKEATILFQRACDAPNGSGCAALAGSYEFGLGVERDLSRAAKLAQRACDLGEVLGCVCIASYLASGKGVAPDARRAQSLFIDACTKGDTLACAVLRAAYHEPKSLNRTAADTYAATWEKTCRAGLVGDCTSLGLLYLGTDRLMEGTDLIKKSCEANDQFACWVQKRM